LARAVTTNERQFFMPARHYPANPRAEMTTRRGVQRVNSGIAAHSTLLKIDTILQQNIM
jgi:hypothetical protein